MIHVSEIRWDTEITHWDSGMIHWDSGIHWDTGISHWDSGMIHVSGIQPAAKSPRSAAELL